MDRHVSLSRAAWIIPRAYHPLRPLEDPLDPWKNPDKAPRPPRPASSRTDLGREPRIIGDIRIDEDDPAPSISGLRSLIAIPHYHEGAIAQHGGPHAPPANCLQPRRNLPWTFRCGSA